MSVSMEGTSVKSRVASGPRNRWSASLSGPEQFGKLVFHGSWYSLQLEVRKYDFTYVLGFEIRILGIDRSLLVCHNRSPNTILFFLRNLARRFLNVIEEM